MTDSSIEDIPPPPTQPRKPTRLTTPINSNVLQRLVREDADVMFADADTEDSDSSDVVDITDNIDVVDVDDCQYNQMACYQTGSRRCAYGRFKVRCKEEGISDNIFGIVLLTYCAATSLLIFSCRPLSQLLTLRYLLQRRSRLSKWTHSTLLQLTITLGSNNARLGQRTATLIYLLLVRTCTGQRRSFPPYSYGQGASQTFGALMTNPS
jgi:hypothetical protein